MRSSALITTIVLMGATAVIAAVALLSGERSGPSASVDRSPRDSTETRFERQTPIPVRTTEPSARERVPAVAPTRADVDPPEVPSIASEWTSKGRVVDLEGMGVGGATVGLEGARDGLAITAAGGWFETTEAVAAGRLVVLDPEWITIHAAKVGMAGTRDHLVVVAPARDLDVYVVDELWRRIEGVRLTLSPEQFSLARIPMPLDATEGVEISARTDEDGHTSLKVPEAADARLAASHPDYPPRNVPIPPGWGELWIELRRDPDGDHVLGIVLSRDGNPVAEAKVLYASQETRTDDHGRFRLELVPALDTTPLVAWKKGWQAAILTDFGRTAKEWDGAPPPVILRLGGPTLAIGGRVEDADGSPRPAFHVSLVEGTEAEPAIVPPVWVERLGEERIFTVTDKSGTFLLEGLLDKEYRLQAWNPRTLELVRSEPTPAGTRDVVLVLPEAALIEIAGRVVSGTGEPVPEVEVRAGLVTFRSSMGSSWIEGPPTGTDERGRFRLEGVPTRSSILLVRGASIVPKRVDLEHADPAGEVEIRVKARCHFSVRHGGAGEPAEWLEAFDESGEKVSIATYRADWSRTSSRIDLEEGDSPVLSLPEGTYELRLLRGSEVARTVTVTLVPGPVELVVVD